MVRKISQRVCEAVTQYLKEHAAADQPWIVEAELSDAEARQVADAGRGLTISGGSPPWIGAQQFVVSATSPKGPWRFSLDAQVSLPATVVVTSRALARGAVIRQSDVEMAHAAADEGDGGAFHSFADVVGKETTRALAAGKPLTPDAIRPATPGAARRGRDRVRPRARASAFAPWRGPATTAAKANWWRSRRWPTAARFSPASAASAKWKCMPARRGPKASEMGEPGTLVRK